MNTKTSVYLFILSSSVSILYSCQTTDKIKRTGANQILLDEEYGEYTKVQLNDVATFEFIPLETTEKSLLADFYSLRHVDDEDIIITNDYRCEVFFFNRRGKAKSSFCCRGVGPNEIPYRITGCFWDAQNRELYLNDLPSKNRILVFNEQGAYLRTLAIEDQYKVGNYMVDFDNNTFLAYDEKNVYTQDAHILAQANLYPYLLLSKKDGKKIGELPFKIPKRVSIYFEKVVDGDQSTKIGSTPFPFWKTGDDFIICEVGLDTIYKYSPKTKTVTPLFSKVPELQSQEFPKTLVRFIEYNDKYVTFEKVINYYDFETKKWGTYESVAYDQQKKTFFRPAFKLGNIGGALPIILGHSYVLPKNVGYGFISAEKLRQNFEAGEAIDDPKLKAIASKIKDDDNDVLFLKHY